MKSLKWIAAGLSLLLLTACSKDPVKQPYTGPERGMPEPAQVQELPPLETDYTVRVDDKDLSGGVLFGGKVFVPRQEVAELWDVDELQLTLARLQQRDMVCLQDVCDRLGYVYLQSDVCGSVQVQTRAQPWQIPEGIDVPVLMYHGVSDTPWGMTDLFVSPKDLEAQLAYITENGYTPIWFEDLPLADTVEKPVILTFDDGYLDNYTDLFPLLQKYRVKATVFVVTGSVGHNPNFLTQEQVREMSDSGLVSIQNHTVTHPYLNTLTPEQQRWELEQAQKDLYAMTGKVPTVFCYPSGRYDTDTLALVQEYFSMAVKMNGNRYRTGEDPYLVDRYYISHGDGVGAVAAYIQ